MLMFIGIYLVVSCALAVALGRLIKFGAPASVTDRDQDGFVHPRILERGSESYFGSRFRTFNSQ